MYPIEPRAPHEHVPTRFELRGKLGEGAMGVVHKAYDRRRGAMVALKILRSLEGVSLYHFKREFRALSHICHPNLVALYELIAEGELWFFTMELINGVDILSYVRPDIPNAPPAKDTIDDRGMVVSEATQPAAEVLDTLAERSLAATEMDIGPLFDEKKVRAAARGLAEGVAALHRAGRLHRDLKPSNILVARNGRVVVLDFGLVTTLGPDQQHESTMAKIVGTAGYMSPEQSLGRTIGTASDWYAFGVLLYELLTGTKPFVGSVTDVITRKVREDARRVSELVPRVPADLDELCARLLSREPSARPDAAEILQRLGAASNDGLLLPRPHSSASFELVGRQAELATLNEAFGVAEKGRTVAVLVGGPAGSGKTALVDRFVERVKELGPALVLRGACDEREMLPFKAFDAAVDALAQLLRPMSEAAVTAMLPEELRELVKLFPVLSQVGAIERALAHESFTGPIQRLEPREIRTRAFRGMRTLLAKLSTLGTVVIAVDDLQWGDTDSAALLTSLLQGEGQRLLLIGAHRSEDELTSPLFVAMQRTRPSSIGEIRRIALAPLSKTDARALALRLLGDAPGARLIADRVVEQSGGLPHFIVELCEPLGVPISDDSELDLDGAIERRILGLPDQAVLLAELVAVAGSPLPQSVLLTAAGLGEAGMPALRLLEGARLVRTRALGRVGEDEVLAYHPRVREVIAARVSDKRRFEYHQKLATAFETSGPRDVEALAMHFYASGEREKARAMALLAAHRAEQGMAFSRAALFYEVAADLGDNSAEQQIVKERLAKALMLAGRGADAAERYLQLAQAEPGDGARKYLKAAAEQFLFSGHVDRGRALMEQVLVGTGTSVAATPRRALLSLLGTRLKVRLRGLRFVEKPEAELLAVDRERVDTFWSVATGLGMVDSTLGSDFQARHLLLALDLGEPYRVVRALAMEACYSAAAGVKASKRVERVLAEASTLAKRLADPHALGLVAMARAASATLLGRFELGRKAATEAEAIFRERCQGVAWEISTAQVFHAMSSTFLGQLAELRRFVTTNLSEAADRGDRYGMANLRSGFGNLAFLVADQADEAQAALDETKSHLPAGDFSLPHMYETIARANLLLYRGKSSEAQQLMSAGRELARGSVPARVQLLRIAFEDLYARSCLARAYDDDDQRGALLLAAEDSAARLALEPAEWSRPLSRTIRAAVAHQRGRREEAVPILDTAIAELDGLGMALHATAARRLRGVVIGGEAGQRAVAEAQAFLSAHGVRRPEALLRIFGA